MSGTLIELVSKGKVEEAIALLEASPDRVNEGNKSGLTPLMAAVRSGGRSPDLVKVLLERFHADPNLCDTDGWTALHWCVNTREQMEQTHLLITYNASVSAKEKRGWSALHFAAYKGYLPVMRLLIQSGADIAENNNDGLSPVQLLFQSWTESARNEVWPPEKHHQAAKELLDFAYECTVEKRSQLQTDR